MPPNARHAFAGVVEIMPQDSRRAILCGGGDDEGLVLAAPPPRRLSTGGATPHVSMLPTAEAADAAALSFWVIRVINILT